MGQLKALTGRIKKALTRVDKACPHGLDDYKSVKASKTCKTAIGAWVKLHMKAHRAVTGGKPAKRGTKPRVATRTSGKKTYGAWWNDPSSY